MIVADGRAEQYTSLVVMCAFRDRRSQETWLYVADIVPCDLGAFETANCAESSAGWSSVLESDLCWRLLLLIHVLRATVMTCLLYTSPSPRDATLSRMPSSA